MSNREGSDRDRSARMRWIALGVAGCLIAASVWLNATSPDSTADEREETVTQGTGGSRPVLTVDAYLVSASSARNVVEVAGILAARRMVDIAAEIEGRVERVAAQDHTHVDAGELLVELDSSLHEAAVMRTSAALLRAQAGDRLAKAELSRQSDLSARGASSSSALDKAESEAAISSAQVAESKAALVEARTRLAKARIEAPFAGIVGAMGVDPGAYLRPGDPIAQLADLSEMEIEVGVGEQEILSLRDADRVRVAVDAVPGQWFDGRIDRTGRLPDPKTRKYPVPVRVPNPDEQLLPGMLGTVRFELGEERAAIRVPRRAVVREFDLEHVFVLKRTEGTEDEATVERRRVVSRRIGFRPDLLELTSGLEAGERIAISGIQALADGVRVRTQQRHPAELAESRPASKAARAEPDPSSGS
jgi:membrane fusion protein (multidrug efflux system)